MERRSDEQLVSNTSKINMKLIQKKVNNEAGKFFAKAIISFKDGSSGGTVMHDLNSKLSKSKNEVIAGKKSNKYTRDFSSFTSTVKEQNEFNHRDSSTCPKPFSEKESPESVKKRIKCLVNLI